MKVFIVDDDPDVVGFMSALLEDAGHEVSSDIVASTAVSQIARRKPDCVLTDLVMAELDGLEMCRELRGRTDLANPRIIVVSARPSAEWEDRALEAGADGYIEKPLDAGKFVSEVERIANRPG